MAFSVPTDKLRRAGWRDPTQAEALFDSLRALGVDGHYAELAIKQGPTAVANLVEHRAEKSADWADKARALISSAAPAEWKAPVLASAGGTAKFRADVQSGRLAIDGKDNAVRFYREEDDYGQFSNFAPFPFTVSLPSGEQIKAPTTEHFFQALKFWTSTPEHAQKILNAKKPKQAADLGRDRKQPMRADWESIKEDVMRLAIAHKITQHPELEALLRATKDAPIVEHAPLDGYWGNAYELGGAGKNMLGQILEEVRSALIAGTINDYIASALDHAGLSSD